MKSSVISENRKARYLYSIEEVIDAGMVLKGNEIKTLRIEKSKVSVSESYASLENGELWLINSHIPEYSNAARIDSAYYDSRRMRKLLVKKIELKKIKKRIEQDGMTLVPLRMYFNHKGIAKLALAIAKGKKLQDKRETSKKRDWDIAKRRLFVGRG